MNVMPMAKRNFGEERAFLLDNEECFNLSHHNCYPPFETAIAKGVSNHVGKWPSHLFAAFLAASLVFAAFLLFALVTALFCIPSEYSKCRRTRDVDFTEFPNIYFIKHVNRTWSQKEFCYMESAARNNPDTYIYLINLLTNVPDENPLFFMTNGNFGKITNDRRDANDVIVFLDKTNNSIEENHSPTNVTDEEKLRSKLSARYFNVINVDVLLENIFKGSILANVFRSLDPKTLEIAAKANILWNTPGIALDAQDFRNIYDAKRYLCRRECKIIKNATINEQASFQASGVPCHAFIGSLMRQIAAKSIMGVDDVVARAREDFCQSSLECPGLEILNKTHQIYESLDCPTVVPPEMNEIPVSSNRESEFTDKSE